MPSFQRSNLHKTLRLFVFLLLIQIGLSRIHADYCILTNAGVEHRSEIEKKIAPVELVEKYPHGRRPGFRCLVLDVVEDGDRTKPWDTPAGQGRVKIMAIGPKSKTRSKAVWLPLAYVTVNNEFDTFHDLRLYLGAYDRSERLRIGSRRYMKRAFAAIDPTGDLGLNPNGGGNTDPISPEDTTTGFLARVARNPDTWLMDAQMSKIRQSQKRHSGLADPLSFGFALLNGIKLQETIARDNRYRMLQPGFSRIAKQILQMEMNFASLDPSLSARNASLHERSVLLQAWCIRVLMDATPGTFSDYDPWDMRDALNDLRTYRPFDDEYGPAFKRYKELENEIFETDLESLKRTRRDASLIDPTWPIDPSEHANVALDLLLNSDAPFFASEMDRSTFADLVLKLAEDPHYPNPRDHDRFDLSNKALQTLVYFIDPPSSDNERVQQQREAAAERYRDFMHQSVMTKDHAVGIHRLFANVLRATGGPRISDAKGRIDDYFKRALAANRSLYTSTQSGDNLESPNVQLKASGARISLKNNLIILFEYLRIGESGDPNALKVVEYLNSKFGEVERVALEALKEDPNSRTAREYMQLLNHWKEFTGG